jgi:NAD(P)-dependent dehydrogenase (short-subunit alcohol dehydrogenase family)
VHAIQGDVALPAGIEAIVDALRDEARLDVLINNAGTTWGAPIEKFPAKAWDSVMAVNVKAPFMLVQALLSRLRAAASDEAPARVINIGSIYGVSTHVQTAWSYAASKSAIHQLTAVLAAELAPHRILVNAIAPGFFPSKMTRFVLHDERLKDEILQSIPLGRAGQLEDIGGLALFLGSRASAYMTGNIIPLDGGVLASR